MYHMWKQFIEIKKLASCSLPHYLSRREELSLVLCGLKKVKFNSHLEMSVISTYQLWESSLLLLMTTHSLEILTEFPSSGKENGGYMYYTNQGL